MTPDEAKCEYIRLSDEIDALIAAGKGDGPEHEALCNRMERPWYLMDTEGRQYVQARCRARVVLDHLRKATASYRWRRWLFGTSWKRIARLRLEGACSLASSLLDHAKLETMLRRELKAALDRAEAML